MHDKGLGFLSVVESFKYKQDNVPVMISRRVAGFLAVILLLGMRTIAAEEPILGIQPNYQHIQTWSVLYGNDPVERGPEAIEWAVEHFDLIIQGGRRVPFADWRINNPDIQRAQYFDCSQLSAGGQLQNAWNACLASGRMDCENMFVHAREDAYLKPEYPNSSCQLVQGNGTASPESRIIGWVSSQYLVNLGYDFFKQYCMDYVVNNFNASEYNLIFFDGAFIVPALNCSGNEIPLLEYSSYNDYLSVKKEAMKEVFTEVRNQLGAKVIVNGYNLDYENVSEGRCIETFVTIQQDITWLTDPRNLGFRYQQLSQYKNNPREKIDVVQCSGRYDYMRKWGIDYLTREREQLYCLASYYLIQHPNSFYSWFDFNQGIYSGMPQERWYGAMGVDVGLPEGQYWEERDSLNQTVLLRNYTKALIISKPPPYWLGYESGTESNYTLSQPMRPIDVNGTVQEAVGMVSLKGGIGFILLKEIPATCSDGIKNGDEEGVDCGGSCQACNGIIEVTDENPHTHSGGSGGFRSNTSVLPNKSSNQSASSNASVYLTLNTSQVVLPIKSFVLNRSASINYSNRSAELQMPSGLDNIDLIMMALMAAIFVLVILTAVLTLRNKKQTA